MMISQVNKVRCKSEFSLSSITIVFAILLVMTPQGFAKDRPEWIQGKIPQKWERSRFLSAVGNGKTLEESSASSRKALAEMIHVTVQSKYTKSNQSTLTDSTNGKTEGADSTNATSNLELVVGAELTGSEIVESYFDDSEKLFYSFAVIDKLKTKNIYSQKATKLRAAITAKLSHFTETFRPADGEEILEMENKFDAISREYSVFADGMSLVPALSAAQIEQIKKKLREVGMVSTIFLDIEGEMFGLREMVGRCLTDKGLTIVPDARSDLRFVLSGALTSSQQPINVEGWVKYEFLFKGNLQSSGNTLGSFSASRIGSGRKENACFDKVKEELLSDVCTQILKLVNKH